MNPIETSKNLFGRLCRRTGDFLGRFARARDGIAALEFAVISPIMISLYFGVTELSDALTAGAKTTAVAASAADLVAQDTKICNAEMNDIFSALDAIMFPYPGGNMHIVISSLIDAGNGTVKVAWTFPNQLSFSTQQPGGAKEDPELKLAPSAAEHPAEVNLKQITWYSLDPERKPRRLPIAELPK